MLQSVNLLQKEVVEEKLEIEPGLEHLKRVEKTSVLEYLKQTKEVMEKRIREEPTYEDSMDPSSGLNPSYLGSSASDPSIAKKNLALPPSRQLNSRLGQRKCLNWSEYPPEYSITCARRTQGSLIFRCYLIFSMDFWLNLDQFSCKYLNCIFKTAQVRTFTYHSFYFSRKNSAGSDPSVAEKRM